MQDYRCYLCNKLLFRARGEAAIAVKCPRCKNSITLKTKVKHINSSKI